MSSKRYITIGMEQKNNVERFENSRLKLDGNLQHEFASESTHVMIYMHGRAYITIFVPGSVLCRN